MLLSWTGYIDKAETHRNLRVALDEAIHPSLAGFRKDYGLPLGQDQDWRMELPHGRCAHVREYPDYYRIHIDEVDPQVSVMGHLLADCPALTILGGVALGALIGHTVGKLWEA